MHLLLYSGMVVLFIGTTLVALNVDVWGVLFHQEFLVGSFYLFFELFLDVFGVIAVMGLLIAIYRRIFSKPLNLPTSRDDVFILSALMVILLTGFVMEAIRLAIDRPAWAPWSFVGYQIALAFGNAGLVSKGTVSLYQQLWWFHAILALAAVACIPYTKLFHLITSPLNALFVPVRPNGQLSSPFDLRELLASGSFDIKVGAAAITDFSWQQRLSFDSCTSCGRCTNACPATAGGTLLSPMHLILKLRGAMFAHRTTDGGTVVGGIVDPEELWACTTCRACVNECPVLIDHVDSIVDMRRHLVAGGKLDSQKRDLLTNLNNVANPLGLPQADRMKWAEGLDVKTVKEQPEFDVLYWVGCAGAYDPRNQNVSRAMVKILKAANIRFSVLGTEEKCNCEVARRLGEEGRFQQSALELIELFKKYNVKVLLTQCPHCFNTFKNEYPEFGADMQVIHHTQFIAHLVESGQLKLKPDGEKTITFHDPCYLGRYNTEYESPRQIISKLGSTVLKEMPRNRDGSFCCGAGGANFWYKVQQKKKVNIIRFEETLKLDPDIVATACPFCTSMFEDAAGTLSVKESVTISDIAELAADKLA
jgi:Fe-S oxidoreductase/nitrate reductase gamma subunit